MENVKRAGPQHSSPFRFNRVWFGPSGLRAGWAVLLYCAINGAALFAFAQAARLFHHPFHLREQIMPGREILVEGAMCVATLLATCIMSRIDRKSWRDFGLRAPRRAAHFTLGAVHGIIAVSAIMALLIVSGGASVEYSGASVPSLLESGLLWAIAFLLVAASEELAFRGYVFFRLAGGTHPVFAAAITSLVFGASHASNHGENIAGIVPTVMYGLVACLAIWRTRSVWWVLGLHTAWNWAESFLFGAPDSGLTAQGNLLTSHAIGPVWLSGGTVGPEGSVLAFPALAALAFVAWRTLPAAQRTTERDTRQRTRRAT